MRTSLNQRLQRLENEQHERFEEYLRTLSDDELNALIIDMRAQNPAEWAQLEAMSDAELEALCAR